MTTLTQSFEAGTSGTGITTANTGGTGNTPADSISTGTGTAAFSGAHPAHGTLGCAFTNQAATACYFWWQGAFTNQAGSGASGVVYARAYVYLAALPSTTATLIGLDSVSGNHRCRVTINSTGHVLALDAVPNTQATSTTVLSTATQYRIEVACKGHASTGTLEVRIYAADSTTPLEVLGPFSNINTGGPIFGGKFGHAAASSNVNTLYVDDLGMSDITWLGPAVVVPSVAGTWAGAVSDTGASVAFRTANITAAQLRVSTTSDLATSPITSSAVTVDAQGNAICTVSGLTPDTTYFYGIVADSTLLAAPVGRGTLRTFPADQVPVSFSVAFGSCQQTNSNSTTFPAIAAYSGPYGPVRMLCHEGDLHYRDFNTGTTLADIVNQYALSLNQPNMVSMMGQLPMSYTWDNHDWGGQFSNASLSCGNDLKTAYRSFVPHYPLADLDQVSPTGAIYQTWTIGRVRFIDLDTRSERSPYNDPESSSKYLLSQQQENWLYDQLSDTDHPLKIIVCGFYWREDSPSGDRWGAYTTQFDRIKTWFRAHPDVNAYVICGDRHALCADDGTSGADVYLPQFDGAPFDQGGTPSSETWSAGYYDLGNNVNLKCFGVLDIEDGGATITVHGKGITANDGIIRVSMDTVFDVPGDTGQWGVPI